MLAVGQSPRLRQLGERLSQQFGGALVLGRALDSLEAELLRPVDHCLLMDWTAPVDGPLAVAHWLAEQRYELPHVALVPTGDVAACVQAMRNGAIAAFEAGAPEDELLAAIGRAWAESAEQRRAARAQADELRALRSWHAALKPIERETMLEMVRGVLNKQAAHKLSIAERTVKKHRACVLKKMGAASIPDLVRIAVRLGLD